jgi:magnesium-transporting ATPase (P-type)
MVLADDNFASIAAAVEEGRTVYDNLRKAVVYVLPTSVAQASMVLIAVLLGMTLPITPVQILWVNMVTAVTLSLAIAFERPEPGLMARPPRDPREPLVNGFMLWRIAFVTVLLAAASFGIFLWKPGAA